MLHRRPLALIARKLRNMRSRKRLESVELPNCPDCQRLAAQNEDFMRDYVELFRVPINQDEGCTSRPDSMHLQNPAGQ